MIKNYFKIAWRNLLTNKTFTAINILGLTVGISCCLLMAMYLKFELSFDKFHSKADRLVRVVMSYSIGGEEGGSGDFTSAKVFPKFQQTFPEVTSGIRMVATERLVKYEDKVINEPRFIYADSTFFSLFDFDLLQGSSKTVLNNPNTVVITESMARKYFGNTDPINKTLQISSRQEPYVITGVSKDCPKNSQIAYDFVASISSFGGLQEQTYWNANYTTYLLLNKANSVASLQTKIDDFMQKEVPASEGATINFTLEKFTEIHLLSPHDAITPNTSMLYIYIVAGMAILLLVIACFTYINLSTARSVERAREVGVRKAIGAQKSQLFWQFISESILVTGISLFLSLVVASLVVPYFNSFSGMQFNIQDLLNLEMIAAGIILFLIIAIFAGSYPALILTGFEPVSVLKGSFKTSRRGVRLGNSLIVFQFGISIFLIIATLVVKNQMNYIQSKKLGYEKDHSLLVSLDGKMQEKLAVIKSEINNVPGVVAVGSAYNSPLHIQGGYNMSGSDISQQMAVTANPIDEDFIKACGIKIIAGQDLNKQDIENAANEENPSFNFILNKSAARILGWSPEEAVGQVMYMDASRPGKVKGVVEDFHFESLHSSIKPLVLFPSSYTNNLIIRTASGEDMSRITAAISAKMKVLAPHRPFEYTFMDAEYRTMYASEKRTEKVFNVFGFIALLLACLGLFGLSTYTIKQRFKEIGVRKVLGASVSSLSLMISGSFLKLILIAFVITAPLAYWGMNTWLANFAYRVNINWRIMVVSGLAIVIISLLTVSYQTIKAAWANPVKSLRSE